MSGAIRIHRVRLRFRDPDAWRSYKVRVDGYIVGTVRAGRDLAVPVEAGRHIVRLEIDWCRSRDVEVEVPDGGVVNLECKPNGQVGSQFYYPGINKTDYITLEPRS
jgi:hypothetical protein